MLDSEQPVASSSRHPATASPPASAIPCQSRRRRRMRVSGAAVALVLSLSIPYVAASPLPDSVSETLRSSLPPSSTTSRTVLDGIVSNALLAAQGAAHAASRMWMRGESRRWATVDLAKFESTGLYRVPTNMVVLDQGFNAGFVVLSYLIAVVGSWCTLELLIRRTSNRGAFNFFFLLAAGICFGAVSTFAMHFVANQALSLHHPLQKENSNYATLYLAYDAGYTILSLVASCLAMTFAFFVMATNFSLGDWRDWPCMPGRKNRRRQKRRKNEEYSKWKKQKAMIKKSANIGTMFAQAGMAASWSLMDTTTRPRAEPKTWRSYLGSSFSSKSPTEVEEEIQDPALFGDDEDALVKSNKLLTELDFRFGRKAVREELERRHGVQSIISSTGQQSLRHMSSDASLLPTSPLAVYYPPPRRPSIPLSRLDGVQSGYNFPPRNDVDPASSTGELVQHSAPPPGVSPNDWPSEPSVYFPDASYRRASLPAVSLSRAEPATTTTHFPTLTRIQSLPEADADPSSQSMRQSVSLDKVKDDEADDEEASREAETASIPSSAPPAEIYDEESQQVAASNWRHRLRAKVASGVELTRMEQLECFLGLDVVTWGDIVKMCLTGMLAGWGVAAMHYIGQVSINDIPYIAYKVGYVVGSVVIASGAVIVALYIMFIMLRPKLKHSWVSKVGVAIILAGAVCGMHYTAAMGTIYAWPDGEIPSLSSVMTGTKRLITGLVSALAFCACLGVFSFIFVAAARDRKERARRRRVVVACVLIDDEDRILVNPADGLLPMCDIASLTTADVNSSTRKSSNLSFNSESTVLGLDLTPGHDAFVSALRMSWSWRNAFWTAMNPFATSQDKAMAPAAAVPPAIALQPPPAAVGGPSLRRPSVITADSSFSALSNPIRLSAARFVERFATSSTNLAVRLTGHQEGVSRLGVLYDQILTTGWVRLSGSTDTVSKGQLIFLVRRVTLNSERNDLLSRHFIFADASSVAVTLHKVLSTPLEHTMPFLDDIRTFCDSSMRMQLRPNALYAGVAVVQATPFDGLRILLENQNRSQLPMREICTFAQSGPTTTADGPELIGTIEEIGESLTWLDGMNLLQIIARNMGQANDQLGGPRVPRLLQALERAIVPLLDTLLSSDDMAHILPHLTLHPVLVPLTPVTARSRSPLNPNHWAAPYVIVFYANYDVAVNTFTDKWLPFSLFRAQHDCVMAQKVGQIKRIEAGGSSEATPPNSASGGKQQQQMQAQAPAAPLQPTMDIYARRPSRVQFEFPPQIQQMQGGAGANSGPAGASSPSIHETPSFSGYTFPPRDPTSSPLVSSSTVGIASATPNAGSPSATSMNLPSTSVTALDYLSGGGSRNRQAPRRSSLAKNAFFANREDEWTRETPLRAPGIAQWDPDWLLKLLRSKLRANA